ncbi:uncharacterized protein OCT59_006960 [Rhizophagus irregularis]|uniref:uncharacterized protein n=1 Tax=Rhizophagus irregularis TaxID=588596 RepID=UPI00331CD004|nr:hypothetical protein OCT59_006960 [Rhizophagus irregularis]
MVSRAKIDRKYVPSFTPYNSNMIPTKEAVEEFDNNNKKMADRLAKEDKTKRINSETVVQLMFRLASIN